MSIVVFEDVHKSPQDGGTASYDRVWTPNNDSRTMPAGALGHICLERDGGWQIIGVWDSKESHEAAHNSAEMADARRRAGIAPAKFETWEVHNHFAADVDAKTDVSTAIVALAKEHLLLGTRKQLISDYDATFTTAARLGMGGDMPADVLAHICILKPATGGLWQLSVLGVWASEAAEKAAHGSEATVNLFKELGRPASATPSPDTITDYPIHLLRLKPSPGNS